MLILCTRIFRTFEKCPTEFHVIKRVFYICRQKNTKIMRPNTKKFLFSSLYQDEYGIPTVRSMNAPVRIHKQFDNVRIEEVPSWFYFIKFS